MPSEDFEVLESERRPVQPALVAEETMEGVCKYILGPGSSKNILGIPISNSSPDKFLIVTKNADESLTFKYFSSLSELSASAENRQDNEALRTTEPFTESDSLVAATENIPENISVEAGGVATNNIDSTLNSLEEISQSFSRTIADFRSNGDTGAARSGLNALINRLNGGESYF